MKAIVYFLRSALFIPTLLYFAIGTTQALESCEPVVGQLVSAEGLIEVQRAGNPVWQQAQLNDVLCQGDSVRSTQLSRAALSLVNETVLRVDENTTIRLANILSQEEEKSFLSLIFGAFQSFSRKPRQLEIDTPYLNGAIEGTEFVFRVEQNRTLLNVLEGRVLASNTLGNVRVSPGEQAVAEAGQAPVLRTVVRPRDAVQWALYYPPLLALDGASSEQQYDAATALANLEQAGESERDAGYYLHRAALLLSVGRVDQARPAIEQAIALNPQDGRTLALRAIIAVVQNNKDQAMADARQAVALSPDLASTKIALSYAQQASFQITEARDTLLQAVESQPDNALAWARLAELWLMLGEREQALTAAQKAGTLAPDLSRTQITQGFAALAGFRSDEARAAFERAIGLNSADPLPHFGLGLAQISTGQLDQGRRNIEIAVGLDSSNALLRAYLGKAYFEEKRAPLDDEQYSIAKQLDPLDPTAYLYSAISKQTENRPVEALRDLQASIERNDNRAVYRGRQLLDQDRAARGTSLARVYKDLGFSQLGINESAQSLKLDPGNASAHRFLSDSYRSVPRREIARVSELLQAQLLQDVNINPVQPSISETNLNITAAGGPAQAGFNEFTPLFQRNKTRVDVSAFAGNDDTYGGEAVVSALYDNFSFSAGTFYYDSDGFRINNDLQHNIHNLFAQVALTPTLNVQAELRRRESESGDIILNFDPDNFSSSLRRDFEEDSARLGLRFSPSTSSDLLLSFIYSDRLENGEVTQTLFFPDGSSSDLFNQTRTEEDAYQIEGQYLFRAENFNIIAGAAYAKVDQNLSLEQSLGGFPFPPFEDNTEITDSRAYFYGNVELTDSLHGTLGLSIQNYEEDAFEFSRLNPKLGLSWDVSETLRLRAAYFKVVKPALASNRTVEPTQIAGFNQFFDDSNATRSSRYGLGFDWKPREDFYLGGEFSRRRFDQPEFVEDTAIFEDRDEWFHRLYVYWTPNTRWSISAEAVYDKFESPDDSLDPDLPREVTTFSLPVHAQYFHPSGFFGGLGITYVDQTVRRSEFSSLADGDDNFTVVDLGLGYRFNNRTGIATLSVQNLFDQDFNYQDDSFRSFQDEPASGPYIPDRTIMGRITLNF